MQYNKTPDGVFESLAQKNVDTGMGFERTTAVLSGKANVYETDLYEPVMNKVKELLPTISLKSQRIICDHIRAGVFLLADGVLPSNKDQGYILRRLIRRAVTHANKVDLDFDSESFKALADIYFMQYKEYYPELGSADQIWDNLSKEIRQFRATIEKGLKFLDGKKSISGADAFDLFQTHGFPIEITKELVQVENIQEFEQEFSKHQNLSRTASAGQFKGGLSSHSEKAVKLHTATHLLNAALRQVLGPDVWQKGSNITDERTRFDFTHSSKLTDDQKSQVEQLVNDWIQKGLLVKKETMTQDDARALGALGVFGEKYADQVSVYTVYDPQTDHAVSREFCGGPHVDTLKDMGQFKIQKEEAVSAGVRRIKAVLQ
jgi:alanyl-tRNA synthetase